MADDGWRIPDALWECLEPLLLPRKPHPLGCHNPCIPDRRAMDAIFCVLRTACQWSALDATGICSHSAAHRRFQEWGEANAGPLRSEMRSGSSWRRFGPRGGCGCF